MTQIKGKCQVISQIMIFNRIKIILIRIEIQINSSNHLDLLKILWIRDNFNKINLSNCNHPYLMETPVWIRDIFNKLKWIHV